MAKLGVYLCACLETLPGVFLPVDELLGIPTWRIPPADSECDFLLGHLGINAGPKVSRVYTPLCTHGMLSALGLDKAQPRSLRWLAEPRAHPPGAALT